MKVKTHRAVSRDGEASNAVFPGYTNYWGAPVALILTNGTTANTLNNRTVNGSSATWSDGGSALLVNNTADTFAVDSIAVEIALEKTGTLTIPSLGQASYDGLFIAAFKLADADPNTVGGGFAIAFTMTGGNRHGGFFHANSTIFWNRDITQSTAPAAWVTSSADNNGRFLVATAHVAGTDYVYSRVKQSGGTERTIADASATNFTQPTSVANSMMLSLTDYTFGLAGIAVHGMGYFRFPPGGLPSNWKDLAWTVALDWTAGAEGSGRTNVLPSGLIVPAYSLTV